MTRRFLQWPLLLVQLKSSHIAASEVRHSPVPRTQTSFSPGFPAVCTRSSVIPPESASSCCPPARWPKDAHGVIRMTDGRKDAQKNAMISATTRCKCAAFLQSRPVANIQYTDCMFAAAEAKDIKVQSACSCSLSWLNSWFSVDEVHDSCGCEWAYLFDRCWYRLDSLQQPCQLFSVSCLLGACDVRVRALHGTMWTFDRLSGIWNVTVLQHGLLH